MCEREISNLKFDSEKCQTMEDMFEEMSKPGKPKATMKNQLKKKDKEVYEAYIRHPCLKTSCRAADVCNTTLNRLIERQTLFGSAHLHAVLVGVIPDDVELTSELIRKDICGEVSDAVVRVMTTTSTKKQSRTTGGLTHDLTTDNIQRTLGYTFKESNNVTCMMGVRTFGSRERKSPCQAHLWSNELLVEICNFTKSGKNIEIFSHIAHDQDLKSLTDYERMAPTLTKEQLSFRWAYEALMQKQVEHQSTSDGVINVVDTLADLWHNKGNDYLVAVTSAAKMKLLQSALNHKVAGSPSKALPSVSSTFSTSPLYTLYNWLMDRMESYVNYSGNVVHDRNKATLLVLYKLALMSQARIWKERQLFIKGYSNSGKTTLANLIKKVYPRSFNVPLEANGVFIASSFGDRSNTSIWLEAEMTPQFYKSLNTSHLNQILEGDLKGHVAVKCNKSKIIKWTGHVIWAGNYSMCELVPSGDMGTEYITKIKEMENRFYTVNMRQVGRDEHTRLEYEITTQLDDLRSSLTAYGTVLRESTLTQDDGSSDGQALEDTLLAITHDIMIKPHHDITNISMTN